MPYFLQDDPGWAATDWDSEASIDDIPQVHPNSPQYLFDRSDFARRHGNGTRAEFIYETSEIKSFNKKLHVFYAWPIIMVRKDSVSSDWLFFVQPGPDDAMLPKEGENCMMRFPRAGFSYAAERNETKRFHSNTSFIDRQASRVDNPCEQWKIKDDYWERCMAFEITLANTARPPFKVIIDEKTAKRGFSSIPRSKIHEYQVTFELRLSSSTNDAELNALKKFNEALKASPTDLSREMNCKRAAFGFLMKFQPQSYSSLFEMFPHLANPFRNPEDVPKELMKVFREMNLQQKAAYKDGLSRIPDRVCFVAGGPGADGSKLEMTFSGESAPRSSRNQVLYLIDINRSATDVANKLVEMYSKLGIKRNVIRMYCWSDEMNSATQNLIEAQRRELHYRIERQAQGQTPENEDGPLSKYDKETDESEKMQLRRLALPSLRTRSKSHYKEEKDNRKAPTLEEAVAAYYEEHKDTTYAELQGLSSVGSRDLEALKNKLVGQLYQDFLKITDVVVTTPVTASKFAPSLRVFDPKLVIFDEAPHARELSIMIPIANFCPEAWIFTGDHRQTKPYVGSYGARRTVNKHVLQLRTSTMERAFKANPNMTSLLINHRAMGNLHEPASTMFYDSNMIPAIDPGDPSAMPLSTMYLRCAYIMPKKKMQGTLVSRLLTVLEYSEFDRDASRFQGSLSNDYHQDWVKDLLVKLVKDKLFLHANGKDLGSILIISPYKRAVIEYRKMIDGLKRSPSGLGTRIVEARTVDTAQGYESDVVIFDLVSDWITKHLEDPNRLCVALTRARQAEFILMDKNMEAKLSSGGQFDKGHLAAMLQHCKDAGEFVRLGRRL